VAHARRGADRAALAALPRTAIDMASTIVWPV
jgi:hypothetical protein